MRKTASKVFVVIVTYNGMKWIPECLESTKSNFVIVVDNNSQDGTADFIRSHYPEIVLLEQNENLGFGKANNIGITYALKSGADFVFLLNQDAFLEDNTLAKMIENSCKYPEYGVLSPLHLNREGNGLEPVFTYYLKKSCADHLLTDVLLKKVLRDVYSLKMVNAAAWLIPRETLNKVGGFHPMFFLYGEDDNYCQRVLYHNLKIGICPDIYIRHDSGRDYHLGQKKGSDKYFDRFLNQVKVKYGDVNSETNSPKELKIFYLKAAFKSWLKLDFKGGQVNFRKRELIKNLDFSKEVEETRKQNSHYLRF